MGNMASYIKRFAAWYFTPLEGPITVWRVFAWWELRRWPFNLIIGLYGGICFVVFMWSILTSGILKPGEDAVEPLALLAAPFGLNAAYTLGWIVELPARFLFPGLSPRFGPTLLKLGLGFSLLVATMPAAYWGAYRMLQIVGLIR